MTTTIQLSKQKSSGKPKFRLATLFSSYRLLPYDEDEPGRVVSVYTKRNERGANHFYYDVLGQLRRPSTHAQHRLKLMTISPSVDK